MSFPLHFHSLNSLRGEEPEHWIGLGDFMVQISHCFSDEETEVKTAKDYLDCRE